MSEPEILANAKYMETFRYNLRLYFTVHSVGPLVLWPWGFEFNVFVKNWKEHEYVGNLFAKAVFDVSGTNYSVGNSAEILYTANGASDDYALAFADADLAYTLELPGGGNFGFDYPQDQLFDLAKALFMGYRAMALYVGDHYNYD